MIKHVHSNGNVTIISDLVVSFIDKLNNIKNKEELGTNEIATKSGVSKSQVSLFFNYKSNINLNAVLSLVDAMGYKLEIRPKHKN